MIDHIKIAVCDDSPEVRIKVRELLTEYSKQQDMNIDVIEYSSGDEMLSRNDSFEILFLDIDMPGSNGIETAEKLNSERNYKNYRIIMLSGLSGDWIKDAYRTKAIRYVSKPIEKDEFYDALKVALNELDPGILLNVTSGTIRCKIQSSEIFYARSGGDYCKIYAISGTYERNCSLSGLSGLLDNEGFFIPHRTYLINLKQVKRLTDKYIEMKNGDHIPFSRRKKKELMDAFIKSRL